MKEQLYDTFAVYAWDYHVWHCTSTHVWHICVIFFDENSAELATQYRDLRFRITVFSAVLLK